MVFWLLPCVLIGYFADRKGRNMWVWGLAALVLSPLIAGIVLALLPGRHDGGHKSGAPSGENQESGRREEKRCPECGYLGEADEQYCPRCGEMLW